MRWQDAPIPTTNMTGFFTVAGRALELSLGREMSSHAETARTFCHGQNTFRPPEA
jgi:hypothetical protein